jgi:hypothetical protein
MSPINGHDADDIYAPYRGRAAATTAVITAFITVDRRSMCYPGTECAHRPFRHPRTSDHLRDAAPPQGDGPHTRYESLGGAIAASPLRRLLSRKLLP